MDELETVVLGCYLVAKSCPTLLRAHGLQPIRLLCPRDSPGKNTRVGYHFLLQRIFLTQVLNPGPLCLLHWQVDSLPLNFMVQFSSVAQLCLTLCNPMNCSMPGLPVHHQLPEFTQIHVYRFSDATQPSHPLSSPSPPALNPSQHQSLFQ